MKNWFVWVLMGKKKRKKKKMRIGKQSARHLVIFFNPIGEIPHRWHPVLS